MYSDRAPQKKTGLLPVYAQTALAVAILGKRALFDYRWESSGVIVVALATLVASVIIFPHLHPYFSQVRDRIHHNLYPDYVPDIFDVENLAPP